MERCFRTGVGCAIDLEEISEQIFIGMPFHPPYTDLFEYGIQPVLQEFGLTPWIASAHPGNVDLLCKICRGLQTSSAAIIDISESNPNVHFELGILAGSSKPLILIKQEGKIVPADLAGMEYAEYSDAKTLSNTLRERLHLIMKKSSTYPKIIPYETYKIYYNDSLNMLNSTTQKIDLTHIRNEIPSDFIGTGEWFTKIIEWADEHPDGRVRRIISVSKDKEKVVAWAKQLLNVTKTMKHGNFEIKVCNWKADFPAINMAIFDRRRVSVALTGSGATETAGFTISERAVVNYFVDYYNNVWAKSLPLEEYLENISD